MTASRTPETVEVDYIAPRHLAGGGDPAWVTVPLHRACGWSHGNDPLMPRVILSSPDQKALLRLEPTPDGPWWTLQHARNRDQPAWYATFDAHTPVETIAGFIDSLTRPATPAAIETDPYEPLLQADWVPPRAENGLISPDSTAHVQHHDSRPWLFTTTLSTSPLWQAQFDEHTPPHLIAAFTAALADPRPVARTHTPAHGQQFLTRTRREVPATRVASALEDRIRALTADQRPAPAQGRGAVRRPPTAPGRTR
ncbi:DUF317 domain-containing protein [Streptomyces sp. NPDC058770]|uniref:DUF317 domain-containing protein n=1 Tax=Streptomyces sp. NPDC058770 TaxID=3346631 RepID=UPI0036A13562